MAKDESKGKKSAEEKEAKKKRKKGDGEPKEKKPVSAGAMFLICFLLFLLMLVAGFAVLNFNLFDLRTKAIILLVQGASPYEHERAELEKWQLDLTTQSEQLTLKQAELEKLQTSLDSQQRAQELEQENIDAQRAEAEELMEAYRTRVYEFDQLAAIYGSMEASKAAQSLSLLENIDDIARLLSALKKDQAASILNNMEASLAASVTQRMLP